MLTLEIKIAPVVYQFSKHHTGVLVEGIVEPIITDSLKTQAAGCCWFHFIGGRLENSVWLCPADASQTVFLVQKKKVPRRYGLSE